MSILSYVASGLALAGVAYLLKKSDRMKVPEVVREMRARESHNHASGDEAAKVYHLEPCTGLTLDIGPIYDNLPPELVNRQLEAVQLVSDSGVFEARIVDSNIVLLDYTTLAPLRNRDFHGFGKGQEWAIAVGTKPESGNAGGLEVAWASVIRFAGE